MPRKTVSAARWAAIRSLAEGELPTYPLLAAAAELCHTTIAARSLRDAWEKLDCRKPAVVIAFRTARAVNRVGEDEGLAPAEIVAKAALDKGGDAGGGSFLRVTGVPDGEALPEEPVSSEEVRGRLAELLPRQLAQVISLAERGYVDKTRLDALLAMLRVAERADAITAQQQQDNEKKSDEELAELYERLDRRIDELARESAGRMVSGELPAARD